MATFSPDNLVVDQVVILIKKRGKADAMKVRVLETTKETVRLLNLDSAMGVRFRETWVEFNYNWTLLEDMGIHPPK
jgi:hypothetical protein